MATVKPFKGIRPVKNAEKIACPPYDVISSAEARDMATGNPVSFLHVDKPEIDLPEDTYLYDEKVYQKGLENLEKFIDQGTLFSLNTHSCISAVSASIVFFASFAPPALFHPVKSKPLPLHLFEFIS